MKVSSIHVISVIIKLKDRAVFRNMFSLYMKVSLFEKMKNRSNLTQTFSIAAG